MSFNVEIAQVTVIYTDENRKAPWLAETKSVEGKIFVKIAKWCRHFVRFVTGRALDFRKEKKQDANVLFLDEIAKNRARLSTEAVRRALANPDPDDDPEIRPAKKQRQRAVTRRDESLAGPWVSLDLPALSWDDHEHGPLCMKLLWGLDGPVWMELNEANLAYLRAACLKGSSQEEQGRRHIRGKKGNDKDDEKHQDDPGRKRRRLQK